MSDSKRIALKVDCDTYQGTKIGIPNLLRELDRAGIQASFFFTLGPDRSGRAIRRVFTQKGFLAKMLRSNAVSMYGPKTMLYGTLLPAPLIRKLRSEIKSVAAAGHDVGIHGWDHVHWHDHLGEMSFAEIKKENDLAHEAFVDIFGARARSMAAPGWHSTPASLKIQEGYGLLYSSNTRLGPPHFPIDGGTVYHTLEIPTTLPTWDEALAELNPHNPEKLIQSYRDAIGGTEVHTLHTEVEGMSYGPLFSRLLDAWKSDGVQFLTLRQRAEECWAEKDQIPHRQGVRITLPNRGGFVSSSILPKDVFARV